jgi:predicted nucleotidyltransferase
MYVDPTSEICGISAVRVRDLLSAASFLHWTTVYVEDRLRISNAQARQLVEELLRLAYIRPVDTRDSSNDWYTRANDGATFALASAAKPLTRKTADRKVREFLDRIHQVNSSQQFLHRVRQALLFGSYLTDRPRINDIDIAVELVYKIDDPDQRAAAIQAKVREARQAGRRFDSIADEVFWPSQEVRLFLKSRSRAISLHTTEDGILKIAETRVLFESA